MSNFKCELLLIGPKQGESGKVGGVVVLFENLLLNLDKYQIRYIVADSNSSNYSSKLAMFFSVVKKIINIRAYSHISLNGTAKDYLFFSPILLIMNFFFRKTFSLRKFAGSFDEYHAALNPFNQFLINSLLKKSSANFFETISLVNKFEKFNRNTLWFPNVRPAQNLRSIPYEEGDKFRLLYLSQLITEKGILDLINAVKHMKDVELTVAGPISDDRLININDMCSGHISYAGMIDNLAVYDFISNFHCFVLPTYYKGEGYPGAIIEAFMIGLPVISTSWRQIPELVENSGVLIEPKSIVQLKEAIYRVKREHALFQIKSLKRSTAFQDVPNTINFLKKIDIENKYENRFI
jgi:glycosyltransferase involved in cell wall biosynthesis